MPMAARYIIANSSLGAYRKVVQKKNNTIIQNSPSNICSTKFFSLLLQLSFCGLSAMRRWRESKAWPIF